MSSRSPDRSAPSGASATAANSTPPRGGRRTRGSSARRLAPREALDPDAGALGFGRILPWSRPVLKLQLHLFKQALTALRARTEQRDDRPFGGSDPPAAVFFYLPDHDGRIPSCIWPAGFFRPKPTPGLNVLYKPERPGGRSRKHFVGCTRGGSCASLPTSIRRRATRHRCSLGSKRLTVIC